jgi:HAD superfamily hydrolase (TIGR01549 family)
MSAPALNPPEPYSAIIFDCDGTLVDSTRLYFQSWNALFKPHAPEMPWAWFAGHLGSSWPQIFEEYQRECSISLDPAGALQEFNHAYLDAIDALSEIEVVAEVARRHLGKVPMAVASGGTREIVEATLKAVNLFHLFDAVVSIEDVHGRGKPAPDIFLEAARRLGVPPDRCTVFEDSDEGIEAAGIAGMTATDVRLAYRPAWRFGVQADGQSHPADHAVDTQAYGTKNPERGGSDTLGSHADEEYSMNYDKSEIATIYDEARALTPDRARQWRDLLSTHIDRGAISVVVDLGCGTGRFTELLAAHLRAKVIGIDPSLTMMNEARRKPITGNVEYRQSAAEELPLQDGATDLVFMSQVYHHLADPSVVARECYRVLRRGGYMCIRSTTQEDNFVYRHFFPLQPLIQSELPTRKDIESVFVAAGFAATIHQIVTQVVSSDWRSFVHNSALRADSFLARLSDTEFDRGMAALRAHVGKIEHDEVVTEEIDWFVFTKPI